MSQRILVAGIGNIFLGDDAFGVVVAQRLAGQELPDEVAVLDFGIHGFDLACALLAGYEAAILVDALPRGNPAGTLYAIEPDLTGTIDPTGAGIEAHGLTPERVISLARTLGGPLPAIYVIGCEPDELAGDVEGLVGLSSAVEQSIEPALELVKSWCERLMREVLPV